MSWNQEELNKVYAKVLRLASTDEEFRELLIKDPNTAIKKISDKELPEGFKVKVIENDPDYQATFVLPDFIGDEVDDVDLNGVAGGAGAMSGVMTMACISDLGKDPRKSSSCMIFA